VIKILYTMVFDYRNGTYISQVAAESPEAAIINWATAAKEQDLSTWRITRAELAQLTEDAPLPIENCLNVWCASGSTAGGLMLLNIVATNRRHQR
jgi:hypothetical protein